ncbi:MAG: pyridine nucleotide-disulfide oxidoreductase [Friedmanniella sp.]|nr:pyridine nucleotide-disulfide oxidoreductase [Friedmanniella sp.]
MNTRGADPAATGVGGAVDVLVVGGGQAALAAGYYLQRARRRDAPGLTFALLDAQTGPGGAWRHGWDTLQLFSPAGFSSLPGWPMPSWTGPGNPSAEHVRAYLAAYEDRYQLPVRRPVRVSRVTRSDAGFRVDTDHGGWRCRVLVNATGAWGRPFWPTYPGRDGFRGRQLHTVSYRSPEPYAGQRVAVVGGGNSAAQVLAEVSRVTDTVWVTQREPRFLPDDVDGRALFAAATARVQARRDGREDAGAGGPGSPGALGDIVVVPAVRDARARGVLQARPMFDRLTPTGLAWDDGTEEPVDTVIWCTGFRPALRHLAALHLRDGSGRVPTGGRAGTQAVGEPRLFLVGYGDWTGAASATLIGVGRTARDTAAAVVDRLGSSAHLPAPRGPARRRPRSDDRGLREDEGLSSRRPPEVTQMS